MGLSSTNTSKLTWQIECGFPFSTLQALASRTGMSVSTLASVIGIPERTLARRRTTGRLAPRESERLLRIAVIVEKALDLFEGDGGAVLHWLTTPRKILDSRTPLDYARTEVGAHEVEKLIGKLEYGVFP